jgi:hypothetical protein
MIKLTSIVVEDGGTVRSVRAHAGHMEVEDVDAYLDGIEDPVEMLCISFWRVELYADVGDAVGQPVRRAFVEGAWRTLDV